MSFTTVFKDNEVIPFYLPKGQEIADQIIFNSYREAKAYIKLFIPEFKPNLFRRMAMLEMSFFFTEIYITRLESKLCKNFNILRLAVDRYISNNIHEELLFEIDYNFLSTLHYLEERRVYLTPHIKLIETSYLQTYLLSILFFKAPTATVSTIKRIASRYIYSTMNDEEQDIIDESLLNKLHSAIQKSAYTIDNLL